MHIAVPHRGRVSGHAQTTSRKTGSRVVKASAQGDDRRVTLAPFEREKSDARTCLASSTLLPLNTVHRTTPKARQASPLPLCFCTTNPQRTHNAKRSEY